MPYARTQNTGSLFTRFQPKNILIISIFLNVVINVAFCFSVNKAMALAMRFFVGMSQVGG